MPSTSAESEACPSAQPVGATRVFQGAVPISKARENAHDVHNLSFSHPASVSPWSRGCHLIVKTGLWRWEGNA